MATDKQPPSEMWVGWTGDAMRSYDAPDDIADDEIVDDMVEVATQYADAMLDEFADRFVNPDDGRTRRRKKRGGRRARDQDPEDESGD